MRAGRRGAHLAMENDVRNIPQKLYVLGHPVAHSKSPVMYNAVYGKLGFPWEYRLMDCKTPAEAKAFLAARDFLSINITTPYKPEALAAATARAASAKLAHGANILVKKGDALIAFNTDGRGCVGYLERTGFSFDGAKVAVCGTGPTALAILHAAAIAGASEVLLLSRDKERAREVLDRYVDEFGTLAHATVDLQAAVDGHRSFLTAYDETTFKFGSYTTSTQAIAAADLVINATPLGMREGDPAPTYRFSTRASAPSTSSTRMGKPPSRRAPRLRGARLRTVAECLSRRRSLPCRPCATCRASIASSRSTSCSRLWRTPLASTYRRLNLGTGCKEKKCRSTIEGPAPRERRRVRRSRQTARAR